MPDAALTGRARTLRCSNCMTKWKTPALEMYREEPLVAAPVESVDEAPAEQAETTLLEAPEPVEVADDAIPAAATIEPWPEFQRESLLKTSREAAPIGAAAPRSRRGLRISVVLAVLIIVLVLADHRAIGHFWPPSLRLFNALGLR